MTSLVERGRIERHVIRSIAEVIQSAWRRDGFTLIEVLAALAISSVIIAATATLIHMVAGNFDRGTRGVDAADGLMLAVQRLASDFSAARYTVWTTQTGFAVAFKAERADGEKPARIDFVSERRSESVLPTDEGVSTIRNNDRVRSGSIIVCLGSRRAAFVCANAVGFSWQTRSDATREFGTRSALLSELEAHVANRNNARLESGAVAPPATFMVAPTQGLAAAQLQRVADTHHAVIISPGMEPTKHEDQPNSIRLQATLDADLQSLRAVWRRETA